MATETRVLLTDFVIELNSNSQWKSMVSKYITDINTSSPFCALFRVSSVYNQRRSCINSKVTLADLGGGGHQGRASPSGFNIFYFHAVLGGNLAK